MKKLITVCQIIVIITAISTVAAYGEQIIQATEAMVGAHHATLPDTLNRGFLIQHNAEGVHTIVPYSVLTGVPTTFPSSFPADNLTGQVSVAKGGTGSGSAAGARTNLGADNASNLSSGTVSKTRGGLGADVSAQSGIPVFVTGAISWKTVTQFLALMGVTFNAADNTWYFLAPPTIAGNLTVTGEVIAQQYSTTGVDNQFFVQVANSGTPSIPATDNAGMIWFSTADNTLKVTNDNGVVGSITVTFP